jgi:hypothetical protein
MWQPLAILWILFSEVWQKKKDNKGTYQHRTTGFEHMGRQVEAAEDLGRM